MRARVLVGWAAGAFALAALGSGAGAGSAPETFAAPPACSVDPDPAGDLMGDFRRAVLSYVQSPAGSAVRSGDRHLSFLAREAERLLLPHRDVLRSHVRWALGRLPRQPLPDLAKWEQLPLGATVPRVLAGLESEESPRGMRLALFRDPTRSIWFLRQVVGQGGKARQWLRRDGVLEGIVPPRLIWAASDVDRPVLAFVKRREVFAVAFAYDAASESYLPREITWARTPAPGVPPGPIGSDAAEGVLQELVNAVETYEPKGAQSDDASFAAAARAFAIEQGDHLFGAHRDELRAHARCELLKLPRRRLPDTRSWRVVSTGSASAPTPRMLASLPIDRWDPRRVFAILRSETLFAIEGVRPSVGRRGELDLVAPPVVVRTNDDLEAPVLAIIDADEIFTVAFHYDPGVPGYLADRVALLQRPTGP